MATNFTDPNCWTLIVGKPTAADLAYLKTPFGVVHERFLAVEELFPWA
jgi:hypothetical protein